MKLWTLRYLSMEYLTFICMEWIHQPGNKLNNTILKLIPIVLLLVLV